MTISRTSNLLEMLREAANSQQLRGIRFFKRGKQHSYLSYKDIYIHANCLAKKLRYSYKIGNFERVAITLPNSPEYVAAFFGIIAAGAVPVPLPHPSRVVASKIYASRIKGAITQSRIQYVIGNQKTAQTFANEFDFFDKLGIEVVLVEDLCNLDSASSVSNIDIDPDTNPSIDCPALIQYTSGSTSAPKGVVLTHQQVMANLDAIRFGLKIVSNDVCCSWLPLFHDMGLIGCLLGSIYNNIDLLLMNPIDFIRNPLDWLKLFDKFKATVTAAPNSAYLRCVQRIDIERVNSLDLTSWRIAMNGSEFVDPETIDKFSQHFYVAGFQPEVFLPVYGMAEACLAVTFPPLNRKYISVDVDRKLLSKDIVENFPQDKVVDLQHSLRRFVSVGSAAKGIDVNVLSNNDLTKKENKLGQICIRGDSVTNGYDYDKVQTEKSYFKEWFCTGDLGFFHNGELFVAGRVKDVIVVNGQNYYAHDIELTVSQLDGLIPYGIIAFGLRKQGLENLLILAETSKDYSNGERENIISSVRHILFSSMGISPLDVVLYRRGELPRTSSGKLQRHKGAELYLNYCAKQTLETATLSS